MRKEEFYSLVILFIMLFTAPPTLVLSQEIRGSVIGKTADGSEKLAGAHVFWYGTSRGAITDREGHFTLSTEDVTDRRLIASHVSFQPETLFVADVTELEIVLSRPHNTAGVEVNAKAPETYIAATVQKTEVITSGELEKASCCDLQSCFGTTSSVQPESVDIITDTKQLTMLGLEGVYTQVLLDNVPGLTDGLNTHMGMSFIPGPFIDKIYISKGANSVLQGVESFSGQINVLLRDSDLDDPLLFNAFGNSFLERQYNAYAMKRFGNWSSMLALHGVTHGARVDRNGDGFMSAPLTDRVSALGKWKYHSDEGEVISNSGLKYTWEDRLGGQTSYDRSTHAGGTEFYGQSLENRRFELYNKTEISIADEQLLKLHVAASRHDQDALYGTTRYDAREIVGYANASIDIPYAEEHSLTTGASWRYRDLREEIDLGTNPHAKTYDGDYSALESVPGIFAENSSNFPDADLTVVAGARLDFWNGSGPVFTPRGFASYKFDELTTLRASAGAAYRVAQVFAENPGYFASWRDIIVAPSLEPEQAVNYGINLTRLYDAGPFSGVLSFDAYRTEFSQQVIAELDADPESVIFTNLKNGSAADNLLAEITADVDPVSFRLAYTYSDRYEYTDHGKRELLFNSRHRVLSVLTVSLAEEALQTTLSAQWRSPQLLPDTRSYPEEFRLPEYGDAYVLVNLHAQYRWEWFDVYLGVENLFDFRQENPIVNAANPFDPYFEPSFAWGPVKGRELYVGFRMRMDVFN